MALNALKSNKQGSGSVTATGFIIRLVVLLLIDVFAFWFVFNLFADGGYTLGIAFLIIVAIANMILLRENMYPLRWMLIGLVLMAMFAIYPILFTVFVAFTNYGDGHLFTKQQAIEQITKAKYLPEGGDSYSWTAFVDESGDEPEFALWLLDPAGDAFYVEQGDSVLPAADAPGIGELNSKGIPDSIDGYKKLNAITAASFPNLTDIKFGDEGATIQIRTPKEAAQLEPLYEYDEANDVMLRLDTEPVTEYLAIDGRFTADNGDELIQGYRANVGLENFQRFFSSSALRGPLARIIIWNFAFAFLSVATTFALGLGIAYIFDDKELPGRKIIQSFLLIPYTIPSLITILIWKGMFNPNFGVINRTLTDIGLSGPGWTTDPWLAKLAILIVNLWLGYPYFMLICSGALQAIPQDIYKAAEVDGASAWQKFSQITLPLLLVAVGPLLVASFTFNFNNFNIIYLFIEGGPPIANSPTPAGHTDILISYVYNLAFAGGATKEYGFASAITIVIFAIVAVLTLLQFRFTQTWEEVGDGV